MIFKLPKLPQLPQLQMEPFRKIAAFFIRYKILITIVIFLIAFVAAALWYRGYLLSKMKAAPASSPDEIYNSTPQDNQIPTIAVPSPFDNSSFNNTLPSPFPTFAPLPTIAPYVAPPTTTTNTSSGNNSGNSNCTTGPGVPNSWYSDVYPNPPVSTNNGSIALLVYIRDCNQNTTPVNDNLTVTLTSNDPTANINGASSPVNIQTQNGYASITVSSQNTVTDTFTIQDTSHNFAVTDINNHNPSVAFTNSSNGSGNSNCTTGPGVPNFWYSEVSPPSPITAATGSTVTLTVNIKDCGKNNVSSDNLTLTQTSNDSSLTVNGSSAPASVNAQNGVVAFNLSSQNAGTDTFTIRDNTANFTVTDANNHNPSIVFSGSSAPVSTPTPTPTGTPSVTDTPTPTVAPTDTPTPTVP
jgi:flagellar basal body-associated protein FliL